MSESDGEVLDKLLPIISDFFSIPADDLSSATDAYDIDGWDSIAHVSLMIAIEHAFGIKFDSDETAGLLNIGDLANLVGSKLALRARPSG